ncbi:hypothetical protein F511_04245 [Dorcoceras hygrometricum]|nr:hypothetical protein F511_04245 [Dorcoceras hygrometricum]
MKTSSNKKSSRSNDRKVLMAEESTKSWVDSDSESSSSSSSSSDSEQEETHCLMADHASDDEVFDFANTAFTREDLIQALNDMVHEYKTLSHTFEEIKAENASLKNSSAESSSDELENTDSLKTELSRLKIENDLLRNEASELKAEVDKLTKEMSSWTQSARAFQKLQEIQKSALDRTGLGGTTSPSADAQENHNIFHARLSELVNYINRGGADKKVESSSRGPQQPSNVQIRDSAMSGSAGRTPTFAQSVEIAQRRSVETVLDADRNAESLGRQAAA